MPSPARRRQFLRIFFILVTFIPTSNTKSTIEPCNSTDSCPSLLSYTLPYDSKLAQIAFHFGRNISDLLAANSIPPDDPSALSGNQIIHAGAFLRVPLSCPCVDGIRRSTSTVYTVGVADTLESISEGFGRLVSSEQIGMTNGMSGKGGLSSGQRLVIPLPCTCFGNSNNGASAVYMSYVVQKGEGLEDVGRKFHVPAMELAAINGLGQPVVDPSDIISIPISACSSAGLNWYHESLVVASGSYALTANNCIRCACGPQDLSLRCFPSGIVPSCTNLQCKDSDLFIGDLIVNKTTLGCNITRCVYWGHNGGKIFRSLASSFHAPCPKKGSTIALPNLSNSLVFPSPAPSPTPSSGNFRAGRSTSNFNASSAQRLLRRGTLYTILVLALGQPFLALGYL